MADPVADPVEHAGKPIPDGHRGGCMSVSKGDSSYPPPPTVIHSLSSALPTRHSHHHHNIITPNTMSREPTHAGSWYTADRESFFSSHSHSHLTTPSHQPFNSTINLNHTSNPSVQSLNSVSTHQNNHVELSSDRESFIHRTGE